MISAVLGIIWLDRVQQQQLAQQAAEEELVLEQFIDIPNEQPTPDEGTAGLNKGNGGGSKPKQEKPAAVAVAVVKIQNPLRLAKPLKHP